MTTQTKKNILDYIHSKNQATAHEIANEFNISRQSVHKHLKKLIEEHAITKIGTPPKVIYIPKISQSVQKIITLPQDISPIIEHEYLYISAEGKIYNGIEGFQLWCTKTNQDIQKTATEYVQTRKKYDQYKQNGLINGMEKLRATFSDVYLDHLYYIDFYSIERFGKTKLGQQLLYAKQSQYKPLIKKIAEQIQPTVNQVIQKHAIDAVAFIPPTVKRSIQLMELLPTSLSLSVPVISLMKITEEIAVPQKTLAKLEERIEIAQKTIYLKSTISYNNILLIDDAVGSGATLNETAKKIRKQNSAVKKIIGLALTGSFKGFDVINEI